MKIQFGKIQVVHQQDVRVTLGIEKERQPIELADFYAKQQRAEFGDRVHVVGTDFFMPASRETQRKPFVVLSGPESDKFVQTLVGNKAAASTLRGEVMTAFTTQKPSYYSIAYNGPV